MRAYNARTAISFDKLHAYLQASNLPGIQAQLPMAPAGRSFEKPTTGYTRAGVTALLFPGVDDWELVFMRRVSRSGDHHSGQISFPGGRYEATDYDLSVTALREMEEEIGVQQHEVRLLGALTPLYIPVSRYHVSPFVVFLSYQPHFRIQVSEVDSLIFIPISVLLNPKNRKQKDLLLPSGRTLVNTPYFDFEGQMIWGATAMILSEFTHILSSYLTECSTS